MFGNGWYWWLKSILTTERGFWTLPLGPLGSPLGGSKNGVPPKVVLPLLKMVIIGWLVPTFMDKPPCTLYDLYVTGLFFANCGSKPLHPRSLCLGNGSFVRPSCVVFLRSF